MSGYRVELTILGLFILLLCSRLGTRSSHDKDGRGHSLKHSCHVINEEVKIAANGMLFCDRHGGIVLKTIFAALQDCSFVHAIRPHDVR